jgi:DNA-binding response OmpR family regulator
VHVIAMHSSTVPGLRLETTFSSQRGRPSDPLTPRANRLRADGILAGGPDEQIRVLPVAASIEAYNSDIAGVLAESTTSISIEPAISLSDVLSDSCWNGSAVHAVLLDCHSVRGPAMWRAVFKVRQLGWAGPVLLIVSARTVTHTPRAIGLGASDFVLASAPLAEIESRLLSIARDCQQEQNVTSVALPSGSTVVLRWRTREVVCDDVRVTLPNREIQLLGAFMDSIGQTLSARELGLSAWGRELDADGSLAPYVSSLRRKLAWFGDRFGIRTIRNAGYRFEITKKRSIVHDSRFDVGNSHPTTDA